MRIKSLYFLLFAFLLFFAGCGKYSKPLPPEDFAPAEVKDLAIFASVQGVSFSWTSPDKDARGEDLLSLEGYRVYRRDLEPDARLQDPFAKFDLITEVKDTHLAEELELKRQAEEQGQIARKVSLPEERSKFAFQDSSVKSGKRYLYQIVPVNQGGVEGVVAERIDVSFRGEISQVTRLPYAAEDFEF